nr:PREDICTED: uncharacterized protein LOC107398439 isoform X2 [Tribolium castaneum]|eukprot:XP_015837965.1 PREDICTED: uncharacterized protein LOC107398439 isoform X2 [Tribolium castaneum]
MVSIATISGNDSLQCESVFIYSCVLQCSVCNLKSIMNNIVLAAIALIEEEEEEEVLLTTICKPRCQTNKIFLNRISEGCFNTLIQRHLMDDDTKFKEYFRLTKSQFFSILSYISEDITTMPSTFVKYPISPCQKLAITLRFLATGESFRSMAFNFRIFHNHISKLVREVLKELRNKLLPIYLPKPTTSELKQIAEDFNARWNFPNCCGAIDGKHIRIVCPKGSGSLYFNYKSYFSIVLLALIDARYKFTWVDVGAYGKEGDSGIFQRSSIYQLIHNNNFLPEPTLLPRTDIILPHVIVGDEAFKLTENVLRPYPRDQAKADREKKIFNYRLSRARRTSENAFGILCQTFCIFYTPIATHPTLVDDIVMVSCCLHNLLRGSLTANHEEGGNISAAAFQNKCF